ncbi:MAG: hypothetical protein JSW64_12130 [Candidatus Zixiibacteriota bacterium]|nr:MAG: hypothetical protein JSW64_12130 [candidate division Zixibacteria bacterium]
MKLNEIAERLQKVKSDIESAFEKELIDFDEIEKELSSVIGALQNRDRAAPSEDRFALNVENYI